jgi:hypothetical protein
VVITLLAALTLTIGVGPIVWIARLRTGKARRLLAASLLVATMTGSALLVGPWVLLSLYLRPVVLAALVAVLLARLVRARKAPVDERASRDAGGWSLVLQYGLAFAFGAVLLDAIVGRRAPAGPVNLDFPLEEGTYGVLQGGNSLVLNPFHRWFASDRHALDIVKLNASGNRASGLAPARLTDYASFDAAVRAPCTGTVEEVEGDLPDHEPGGMDWAHPTGNHVLLRCAPARILVAHLRQGSVAASAQEKVVAGQLIGRIGNSGGTREPHLHIGAIALDGRSFPDATAVPLTLGGRYLRINDVLRVPAARHEAPIAAPGGSGDRTTACDRQAARVAAWRGRSIDGRVHEPSWIGHYNDRDKVCYALLALTIPAANSGPPPLVLELWNAFDAALVAESTADPRAEMQRAFCRIDVSEDPFASCAVADFFIRDRMTH